MTRLIPLILLIFLASPVLADLKMPTGEVILEVSGNITQTNQDGIAVFDRAMINSLASRVIVTSNHVVSQPATYEGPILAELLKAVGAKGTTARVFALDDYIAEIKIADIEKYQVILATRENNKLLTIEDKGPLFVVFPFTGHKELRNDVYYNQSVWQIRAIEIE